MPIANSSQQQYLKTYQSLIKRAKSENINDLFDYIKSSDVKDTTKASYLNSIISLKKFDDKLVKGDLSDVIQLRDKLNLKIEDDRKQNNLNENQSKAMDKVSYNNLTEFVNKLNQSKNKSSKDLETYILVRLMTEFPVRNDLQEILLTRHKSDLNKQINSLYLPLKKGSSGTLSLKEYKTSKTHGTITINLDGELTDDIKKLAKDGRKFLFVNSKNEPYSSSSFTHKMNKIFFNEFGVNMSSTILRKIYLTHKYKNVVKEMEQDQKLLGHSAATQKNNYIKNTD